MSQTFAPVSVFRLFLRMGGWIVLILGLVLVILTSIASVSLNTAQRFDAEGRETVAQITERNLTESRDSDGDKTVTYYFHLDYTTNGRREMSIRKSVGSSMYNAHDVGDRIQIWYLETQPDTVELDRGSNAQVARVMQWVGLAFGLAWLGSLWLIGRKAVAAVRARRYGARQEARVQDVERTAVTANGKRQFRLVWRDSQGRTGKSMMGKHAKFDGISTGDTVTIYQGLKISWWSGDVGDREYP